MTDSKNVIISNENLKILIDTVVSRVNANTDKKIDEVKSELKADIAELKTDVAVLKEDVAELKTDMKRVETKVDFALEKQNKYDDAFHHIGKLANNI